MGRVTAEVRAESARPLMGRVTAEVRALLQASQDESNSRRNVLLDARRRDVQFAVGDELLLDTEHTQLPSLSLLFRRWMGPFMVLARPAHNTHRLKIPATWRACDEFNVERLRPYHRRPYGIGGAPGPPPPVPGADAGRSTVRVRSAGAGRAAQVQDTLGPALRPQAGALGGLRRVLRHLGAAGQPHQL